MKGQAAVEFILLIFMLVLVMLSYSEKFTKASVKDIKEISAVYEIRKTSKTISHLVDEIYLSGSGSKIQVKAYLPFDTKCNESVCTTSQYTDVEGNMIEIKYNKPIIYEDTIRPCLDFEGWAKITIENKGGIILCTVTPQ